MTDLEKGISEEQTYLGQDIFHHRMLAFISQRELEKKAGLKPKTLSAIEKSKTPICSDKFHQIKGAARAFRNGRLILSDTPISHEDVADLRENLRESNFHEASKLIRRMDTSSLSPLDHVLVSHYNGLIRLQQALETQSNVLFSDAKTAFKFASTLAENIHVEGDKLKAAAERIKIIATAQCIATDFVVKVQLPFETGKLTPEETKEMVGKHCFYESWKELAAKAEKLHPKAMPVLLWNKLHGCSYFEKNQNLIIDSIEALRSNKDIHKPLVLQRIQSDSFVKHILEYDEVKEFYKLELQNLNKP